MLMRKTSAPDGEQCGDRLAIGRGGAEGSDDLDAAAATGMQLRSSRRFAAIAAAYWAATGPDRRRYP